MGLGIQAASPTTANPFATMQSLWRLTGTCQFPFVFPESPSVSGCLGLLMTGLSATYLSMRVWRVSLSLNLLFRLSSPDFDTPSPMLVLAFPFGKTQPYPAGAMNWSRWIMQYSGSKYSRESLAGSNSRMYLPVTTTSSGLISFSIFDWMGRDRLSTDEAPVASITILEATLKGERSDLLPATPVMRPPSERRASAVALNMNSTPTFLASSTCRLGASFLLRMKPSPSKRTFVFLSGE